MKYRKRPIEVEATQWWKNGDHPEDYANDIEGIAEVGGVTVWTADYQREHGWEGQVVRYFRRPDGGGVLPDEKCGQPWHDHGWIDTFEGGHVVCPGDWIMTGVENERYPCKPSVFEATYEPVEG